MKSVLNSASKQVGGLAKHAATRIAQAPFEIVKQAAGQSDSGENMRVEDLEQGANNTPSDPSDSGSHSGDFSGFATQEHFEQYREKSGQRDDIELSIIRKNLQKEFGVGAGLEHGISRVRQERDKREKQEEQIEQKQQEEESMLREKKSKESLQVSIAKGQASAERGVSQKVMG